MRSLLPILIFVLILILLLIIILRLHWVMNRWSVLRMRRNPVQVQEDEEDEDEEKNDPLKTGG